METSASSSSPLGRVFDSSASGLTVPVEIVDASSPPLASPPPLPPPEREEETTVLEQSGPEPHQDEGESMEISLEDISRHASSHSLSDTLNGVGGGGGREKEQIEDLVLNSTVPPVDSTQLTPVLPSNQQLSSGSLSLPGISTNTVAPPLGPTTPTLSTSPGGLGLGLDGSGLDTTLALQFTQHFQEMSRSLRSEGIEISPENLANNFPQSLAEVAALLTQSTSSQSSAGGGIASNLLESMMTQSVSQPGLPIDYSDIVMNAPNLTAPTAPPVGRTEGGGEERDMDMVLTEPHVPSSPESNFDTNELLAPSLTQDMELTTKLANAGPVGIAAAAAILSGRKRKRHVFECNPALRKRHCSKLMRKLKETLDELSTRVGLQACVVTYRPSSKQEKPEPAFKIFGTSPLYGAIEEQKAPILQRMDEQLKKQIPPTPPLSTKQTSFELPPLVFEGIPTPINEMTQAQLRGFIPTILKYSTGRGKPGWGKEDMKPPWWPDEVPWQNVRSDARSEAQKKALPWTECLRKTIIACYTHHGRLDLFEAAISQKKEQEGEEGGEREDTGGGRNEAPAARQLQLQLEDDHHGLDFTTVMSSTDGVNDLTGAQDQGLTQADQQVFTIDTGVGNCDTSGMPTLADASLAETAARLQQVADETGQVQYATQTVTVTDRDSKALGQPVGSTTTVLLTAYPSGHTVGDTQQSQHYYGSGAISNDANPIPTSSVHNNAAATAAPSVQVVYSASHVTELPESIVSGITSGPYDGGGGRGREGGEEGGGINDTASPERQTLTDTNEYLSRATSLTNDVNIDLASQYISGYTHKPDSLLSTGDHKISLSNAEESGKVDGGTRIGTGVDSTEQ